MRFGWGTEVGVVLSGQQCAHQSHHGEGEVWEPSESTQRVSLGPEFSALLYCSPVLIGSFICLLLTPRYTPFSSPRFAGHLRKLGYSDSHVSTSNFPVFCPYSSPDSIHLSGFWNPCLWNFLSTNISSAFWNFRLILSHCSPLSPLLFTHREAIIVVSLNLSWQ